VQTVPGASWLALETEGNDESSTAGAQSTATFDAVVISNAIAIAFITAIAHSTTTTTTTSASRIGITTFGDAKPGGHGP